MPTTGDVGFIKSGDVASATSTRNCDITSPDASVVVTETATGYELSVAAIDLCELVASLEDNGLTIGG